MIRPQSNRARLMQTWHLYLVRTSNGALYTGIATDVDRRLEEHRSGGARASKFLRSRGPLELAYATAIGSRALASRAEAAVKRLAKKDKERLVAERPDRERLLETLAISGINR